jgi:hypothetical protein
MTREKRSRRDLERIRRSIRVNAEKRARDFLTCPADELPAELRWLNADERRLLVQLFREAEVIFSVEGAVGFVASMEIPPISSAVH